MTHLTFSVRTADWDQEATRLMALRSAVFIAEQGVAAEEEYDGLDPGCVHVVAETATGQTVGTGRLLPDGRIGRMAVAAPWRGSGVGRALLEALLASARQRGMQTVRLNAQIQALGFYERCGFQAEGQEFIEAGIMHRRMYLTLEGDRE